MNADSFETVNLHLEVLCVLKVFVLYGELLVHFELSNLACSVRVEIGHLICWVLAILVRRNGARSAHVVLRGKGSQLLGVWLGQRGRRGRTLRSNAVEGHEPDLVEHVVVVHVTFVENQFQQRRLHLDVHGLQFTRLEGAALVAVQSQVAQFLEGNLV